MYLSLLRGRARVNSRLRTVAVEIRLYIDPDTGQPHIYAHGVTEEEVRQVILRPGEDRAGDEGSRIAIGQTSAGRYLKVIYTRDPAGDSVFVITAFDLRGKPLKAYRRRRRRKPR